MAREVVRVRAAVHAEALAAWRAARPAQAMRVLRAAGYDEAVRMRWIRAVAPRIEPWDAVDMARDAYIPEEV